MSDSTLATVKDWKPATESLNDPPVKRGTQGNAWGREWPVSWCLRYSEHGYLWTPHVQRPVNLALLCCLYSLLTASEIWLSILNKSQPWMPLLLMVEVWSSHFNPLWSKELTHWKDLAGKITEGRRVGRQKMRVVGWHRWLIWNMSLLKARTGKPGMLQPTGSQTQTLPERPNSNICLSTYISVIYLYVPISAVS